MADFEPSKSLQLIQQFIKEFRVRIERYVAEDAPAKNGLPSFASPLPQDTEWIQENYEKFLRDTPNESLVEENYISELGYITALAFMADGNYIVVGHSTGLVQVRQSSSGRVRSTLRGVQFPPRPVYALHCHGNDCYAACTDGVVYRLQVHSMLAESSTLFDQTNFKRELEALTVYYFGDEGHTSRASPFVTSRSPALSVGVTSDGDFMAVGYADTSIKLYDMQTREAVSTYKVHKLRLNFTPIKLQRMHTGAVTALVCHPEQPTVLASGAWDESLRVWDTRCKIGCMMTFTGVNICGNSLDLNRDLCLAGSWQPLDALSLWDLRARKRISIVNAQNRRLNVDGEYIYACQFWRSSQYNRKGKYGIIGGSGTECVEIVNLHNRYVSCSYPARGTILAVASHGDNIAYGGTAPTFNIVSFHDPKHEEEVYDVFKQEEAQWNDAPYLEIYEEDESGNATQAHFNMICSDNPSDVSETEFAISETVPSDLGDGSPS